MNRATLAHTSEVRHSASAKTLQKTFCMCDAALQST